MSREKEKKKGFWKSLLKSNSKRDPANYSIKRANGTLTDVEDNEDSPPPRPRKMSEPDIRRQPSRQYKASPSPMVELFPPRKLHKPSISKGKEPEKLANGYRRSSPSPRASELIMAGWPPRGYRDDDELDLGHAMDFICKGVPAFKGHKRRIPHVEDIFYSTYATAAGNRGGGSDGVNQHDSMTQLMTLKTTGSGIASQPWETMEQPSYSFHFGNMPGTVTLNQWATTASMVPPPIGIRDSGVMARDVDLVRIFGRLKDLEAGLEDDDVDFLYKNLYRRLLRDPDRRSNPHTTLDKQITDLIMVLSRPDHWIDFSQPKNQIVTRFIFDTAHVNHGQYLKFFHQLLLSMELDLRINSPRHGDWAKEKLLEQLPPPIKWSLAISRRWRENVKIEAYGNTADQVKLKYRLKRRQVKMIKRFAQMMKWPNLAETLSSLRAGYEASNLDGISSHAMAFFSGLVLPGPSFPFIMMNSLIDIDPDEATDELALLIHLNPNCGFQYRSSYTYWTSSSIVGKVLAPTCHEVAGWVGPARPTPDLKRSQIARIRSRRPRQRLTAEDVRSMAERSDPLGPPADAFPIKDYDMVSPNVDEVVDTVRIELLTLKHCPDRMADPGPRWFDAAIQFAIDGVSWPLRLTYDVSFISAWPCTQGPHPLFYDYTFLTVAADEVISIRDWAGLYGARSTVDLKRNRSFSGGYMGMDVDHDGDSTAGEGSSKGRLNSLNGDRRPTTNGINGKFDKEDEEDVLVIEAFGVPDNQVLARAWCAHWGLSAVVADIGKTCMACAIREAYAAALTVVILIDGNQDYNDY